MTATAETKLPVSIRVPAREAAIAWRNVFNATGRDSERPQLNRTISVEVFEFYPKGVQFIATNGHILFRAWVPEREAIKGDRRWPDLGERPDRQLTVMDSDGFGIGFMRSLYQLTAKEEHQTEPLTITSAEIDEDAAPSFGAEFQSERVTLRAFGQRLDLLVREEPYPNWRTLKLGLDDLTLVDGMKIAPKYLGLIGKLKDVASVDCQFVGSERAILLDAEGIEGFGVKGLLMPMRRIAKADDSEPETALDETDDEEDGYTVDEEGEG